MYAEGFINFIYFSPLFPFFGFRTCSRLSADIDSFHGDFQYSLSFYLLCSYPWKKRKESIDISLERIYVYNAQQKKEMTFTWTYISKGLSLKTLENICSAIKCKAVIMYVETGYIYTPNDCQPGKARHESHTIINQIVHFT